MKTFYFVYFPYSVRFIVKLLLPVNLYCHRFLHFEEFIYRRGKELVEVYGYSPFVPSFRGQGRLCLKYKNQLDAAYYFIVLLIGSTCFGHYYAHHQELASMMLITTLVVSFLVCCRLEVRCSCARVVSGLQAKVRLIVLEPSTRTPL